MTFVALVQCVLERMVRSTVYSKQVLRLIVTRFSVYYYLCVANRKRREKTHFNAYTHVDKLLLKTHTNRHSQSQQTHTSAICYTHLAHMTDLC